MSPWLSFQSVSWAASVALAARAVQTRAVALAHPRSLRRAQATVVRLITVVAGH